jgi:YlmC/YmxH family sporulation protein
MNTTVGKLSEKQIINMRDGSCLGTISDIEIDICTGRIVAICIEIKGSMLFSKSERQTVRVLWEEIQTVGEDAILVNIDQKLCICEKPAKNNFLSKLFREG